MTNPRCHGLACRWALVSVLISLPVSADETVWGERAALVMLQQQVESMESLIAQAEANADQQRRLKFSYPSLRRDLTLIRQKIDVYLHQPMEPAYLKPVNGDLKQYGSYQ